MTNLEDRRLDEDGELVFRVVNGNTASFEALVNLYKDKVKSLAASVVKDESHAEDITQEVFIKAFKNIKGFQFKSKFSTWLYRITVNTALSALKKQKHFVQLNQHEVSNELMKPDSKSTNMTLHDQKIFIQKAMKRIKTDQALVLRLFYLCEMSILEIVAITKFSQAKVKVDLHRGRKNLKNQLHKILGPDLESLL